MDIGMKPINRDETDTPESYQTYTYMIKIIPIPIPIPIIGIGIGYIGIADYRSKPKSGRTCH